MNHLPPSVILSDIFMFICCCWKYGIHAYVYLCSVLFGITQRCGGVICEYEVCGGGQVESVCCVLY